LVFFDLFFSLFERINPSYPLLALNLSLILYDHRRYLSSLSSITRLFLTSSGKLRGLWPQYHCSQGKIRRKWLKKISLPYSNLFYGSFFSRGKKLFLHKILKN